jgi:acyl-homoserine lactone acylase PvdQ
MKKILSLAVLIIFAQTVAAQESARWAKHAAAVTITRDNWGIAHVRGHTDADAVFGMIYAQAEDDFNRIETNYINSMGRLAEAEGESQIFKDLRMKLYINPDSMKALYTTSPAWLTSLMDAWADGLNFYLAKHPDVTPRVIKHFEPWMALTFSEGSIGGDIERISLPGLRSLYGNSSDAATQERGAEGGDGPIDDEPRGSNGAAIAPSNTKNHHSLLLINPHTSFFFRSELQMTSDEGLNAYGAATWGQFFIYQGFNDRAGWMHTSSGVDNIDEYAETIVRKPDGSLFYRYGSEERPVVVQRISVPYKTATGMATREFTVYRTHHGPIVRSLMGGDKSISVRLMDSPLKALTQSYARTKTHDYKSFRDVMELHTNSSNNTIFADNSGNIAYFHSNFIPRRDTSFDWTRPVDGTTPATEWQGVLSIDETPGLLNPKSGWLYNSNNWPFAAAGPEDSPKKADYPKYVDRGGESYRGLHALRVFPARKDHTLNTLIAAAYDSWMPAFDSLLPPLIRDYDALATSDALKAKLHDPIELLRGWDHRWSMTSTPTTLAVFYGDEFNRAQAGRGRSRAGDSSAAAPNRLALLATAVDTLTSQFGSWKTPWGDVNRYQRLTADIVQQFNDNAPSIPVEFTSATWGSLASFGARPYPGTKKWYGTSGNSFVAVVEFGDSVHAKAVTAGGESGDPKSPHFGDQATRYATGNLRDVYFYPRDIAAHAARTYHPGE